MYGKLYNIIMFSGLPAEVTVVQKLYFLFLLIEKYLFCLKSSQPQLFFFPRLSYHIFLTSAHVGENSIFFPLRTNSISIL